MSIAALYCGRLRNTAADISQTLLCRGAPAATRLQRRGHSDVCRLLQGAVVRVLMVGGAFMPLLYWAQLPKLLDL